MSGAGVLGVLYFSGRVGTHLHPTFQPYTIIASGILLVLGLWNLFAPLDDACGDCCDHSHSRSLFGTMVSHSILIIPVLLAAIYSPDQFGAGMVRNRTLIEDSSQLPGLGNRMALPLGKSDPALPTEDTDVDYLPRTESGKIQADVIDLIYAVNEDPLRRIFEGQEIEVTGQFMPARTGNAQGDRFNLVRMFMMCCAADARPVSITVQSPLAEPFTEMQWVRVTGKVLFPVEGGRRTVLVVADAVTATEPPEQTVIY